MKITQNKYKTKSLSPGTCFQIGLKCDSASFLMCQDRVSLLFQSRESHIFHSSRKMRFPWDLNMGVEAVIWVEFGRTLGLDKAKESGDSLFLPAVRLAVCLPGVGILGGMTICDNTQIRQSNSRVGRIYRWSQSKEEGMLWVFLRDSLPGTKVWRGLIYEK